MGVDQGNARSCELPTIDLPNCVNDLVRAHSALVKALASTKLRFTLDGRLVGDIAEAVASSAFDLSLCEKRTPGADAFARDRRTVQIKASGIGKGPAFTPSDQADHLIFLLIDFDRCKAQVAYNGPEAPVRALLPPLFTGTKRAPLARVLELNSAVNVSDRLPLR